MPIDSSAAKPKTQILVASSRSSQFAAMHARLHLGGQGAQSEVLPGLRILSSGRFPESFMSGPTEVGSFLFVHLA